MKNILTKDGLTGCSGYGVENAPTAIHVLANYAAGNKRCFVVTNANRRGAPWWKRMTLDRAKNENRPIIRCSYCSRPAISLDCLWPNHSEANYCAYHRNWLKFADAGKSTAHKHVVGTR